MPSQEGAVRGLFLCCDLYPSDRFTQVGLHFALSGMYKIQEIEATDFQE